MSITVGPGCGGGVWRSSLGSCLASAAAVPSGRENVGNISCSVLNRLWAPSDCSAGELAAAGQEISEGPPALSGQGVIVLGCTFRGTAGDSVLSMAKPAMPF